MKILISILAGIARYKTLYLTGQTNKDEKMLTISSLTQILIESISAYKSGRYDTKEQRENAFINLAGN